ncbi:MAG: hypothetical protein HYW48_06035 [Deltaproteobacteria bacterium]|nr:hypothetical protein [Deltaproteobacteria bacterium]
MGRLAFLTFFLLPSLRAEISRFAIDARSFPDPLKWTVLENPGLAKFLERQRFFAERTCPLQSTRYTDLVESLKIVSNGLKIGLCKDHHGELVNGLSEMLANMNMAFMMKVRYGTSPYVAPFAANGSGVSASLFRPPPPDDIVAENSALATRTQTIMSQLNEVAKDEQCSDDLRKRGMLSMVGNVSLSVGQMGLLVPTQAGIGIAAAGLGLGSVLKVISALMQSNFDWDNENDRRQFQELNCLFFKIRNELDGCHFFSMPSAEIEGTIETAKGYFEGLSREFEDFLRERKEFAVLENVRERTFVVAQRGPDWLSLYDRVIEIEGSLARKKETRIERERFTLLMQKHAKFLLENVEALKDDVPVKDDLTILLKPFVDEKLPFFLGIDDEEFERRFQRPLMTRLWGLSEAVKTSLLEEQAKFGAIKNLRDNLTNQVYLEKSSDIFQSTEKRFRETLALLAKQIEILKIKQLDVGMGKDNPESGPSYDVLKEYQFITEIVFGHIGWSFLKFLRKDSEKNAKLFDKNMRKFMGQYPGALENIAHSSLGEACRDARHLKIAWDQANASAEVFMDFFDTNRGIIHSQTAKYLWAIHLFPISASYQRKIHRSMQTTDMARKQIVGGLKGNNTKIDELQKKGKNFGMILLQIQERKVQKEALDRFLKDNECFREF